MIRRYAGVCAIVTLLSVGSRPSQAQHEDARELIAHKIAAGAAIEALPETLRPFFRTQQAALVEVAANLAAGGSSNGAPNVDAAHHVVWLDMEAAQGTASQRLAAARSFPHDEAQAKRLMRHLSVHGAGFLPWAVERAVTKLEEAFHRGNAESIVQAAGAVTHLAVDASQPFQTTRLANWDEGNRARRAYADALANYETRLADEVRVSPLRFRTVENIRDETFHTLLSAHESAVLDFAPWLAATSADPGASEPTAQRCITTEDDLANCLEQRIEAGALLAARLIGTAWIRANLPSLPDAAAAKPEPAAALVRSGTTPQSTPDDNAPLIGSRHSKIVHRADCAHVARIKPSNRAEFPTMEAARRAGRRPCRSCKPWSEAEKP